MNKNIVLLALLALSIVAVWRYSASGYEKKIADQKILVVGTNAEFPPYSFIKDDQVAGFDIDVINEVAKRLDKTVQIKDMPFDALMLEAIQGRIQVIAAGLSCTSERQKQLFFTTPHIAGDPLVIVTLAKNAGITSVAELNGKDVVVNDGFTADRYMSNIVGPNLIRLATTSEAFAVLQSGRVFAFVSALSPLKPYFEKFGKDNFAITTIEGTSDNCSLGISKKFPEVHQQIEPVIKKMIEDGTIENLKEKWGIV